MRERPVARDTSVTPPRPSARASDPAHSRRCRSFRCGEMAVKRSAIASSEAIAERYEILHYLSRLFSGGPLALPSDLKVAEVNGARLAYGELGTGQLVVFVHGSISDRTICHAQLPAVAARYRTIAFSRRYAQPYH